MALTYIGEQFTIYIGSIFLILGIVGDGINIFVFSSVRSYRTTPCTFYFLIGSIFNSLYIIINLPIRIISAIYQIHLTRNSISWCRAHAFLIGLLGLTSFTCSCLATIDQFFITSRSVYLRRCSNIKWARRIVFIVIIVWCFHGIPIFWFYNIPPVTDRCKSANIIYATYITIYILVFLFAIPVLIMVIFGWLTYRNIRQIKSLVRQYVDRQLARMTLIQVLLVVISITPFGINSAYGLITSKINKDKDRRLKESFATTIFILISYFYYVVCLFIICHLLKKVFL